MPTAHILSTTTNAFTDIRLRAPKGYSFEAGQYTALGEVALPFSIASAPGQLPELRFLFRSDGSEAAKRFTSELERETIKISAAAGDVTRNPSDTRPLTLVCAGTGISQALSLLQAEHLRDPVCISRLYWARSVADTHAELNELMQTPAAPNTIQYLCDDLTIGPENELQRELANDASILRDTDIVVCGAPAFAYQCLDTLTAAGVPAEMVRADAFSYAPRPKVS